MKAKLLMADADLRKEAALEQSKKKYVMKKRLTQMKKLDEGKDLVGKGFDIIGVVDGLIDWSIDWLVD